ncbi:hypothetical protein L207DRAFT_592753 [Hyaloscypha variabilis F]|uniref:Uncharacterized protein n=1 Tax=Hyaloscypha variabilis (strain UAMH 11265 / GT02V1 / F) TaxID=1149755 RepID=A0A2J6QVM0_HYAVF|nr:hypothetical protein L207DRAFT_592753 [Hyaloscypha variabilis F]
MSWVNIPVMTDRAQPGGRLEIFARAVDVVHAIYKNVEYRHGSLPERICKVCIAVYAQIADDVPSSQSQVQVILNSNLIDFLVDLSILGQNAEPRYYSHALWKYVLYKECGELYDPSEYISDLQGSGSSSSSSSNSRPPTREQFFDNRVYKSSSHQLSHGSAHGGHHAGAHEPAHGSANGDHRRGAAGPAYEEPGIKVDISKMELVKGRKGKLVDIQIFSKKDSDQKQQQPLISAQSTSKKASETKKKQKGVGKEKKTQG